MCFRNGNQSVMFKILVLQTVLQKYLWTSSILAKLLSICSSIKDALLLNYFQGYCQNFNSLLKSKKETYLPPIKGYFLRFSKLLVVTLKYYYDKKKSLVETTSKRCLLFKVPWGRLNTFAFIKIKPISIVRVKFSLKISIFKA